MLYSSKDINFLLRVTLGILVCMFLILVGMISLFHNRHLHEAKLLEHIYDLNARVYKLEKKEEP